MKTTNKDVRKLPCFSGSIWFSQPSLLGRGRVVGWLMAVCGSLCLDGRAGPPPTNDAYANATRLSGEDITIVGITADASVERGTNGIQEFLGPSDYHRSACEDGADLSRMGTLWWRWRAPRAGVFFLLPPYYIPSSRSCSPSLSVWRGRNLSASFPFDDSASPLVVLNSGNGSVRHLYFPFATEEGEEWVFQMMGSHPEAFAVRLLMHTGPMILEEPVDQRAQEGESVLLTVTAAGAQKPFFFERTEFLPGCRYQWWFDGHPLEGETFSVLRIPKLGVNQQGTYQVQVKDAHGETLSREVQVSIPSQPVAPQLEIDLDRSTSPATAHFTLRGESGRIYQMESSSNLVDWVPASVQASSGVEAEDRLVTGWPGSLRDKVAWHGVPFGFQLVSPAERVFVRARPWQSSCDECMTQLWAVQFAKEDWGREEWHPSIYSVSGADIFFRHASPQWIDTSLPPDPFCVSLPMVLGVLGAAPEWPCVFWPNAQGERVSIEGMPAGVWNGARIPYPAATH